MKNGDALKAVFEQDPHALSSGRIIGAAHFQPGLIVSPVYTDDPLGTSGWVRANFSNLSVSNDVSREIEPSWYLRGQDPLVMVFRDQSGSYKNWLPLEMDTEALSVDLRKFNSGPLVIYVETPKGRKARILNGGF